MGVEEHLVHRAKSTVRRHEIAGGRTLYLSYDPVPEDEQAGANPPTQIARIRLPKNATNVSLHGPGSFTKRGKGKVYGVRIAFTEQTEKEREAKRHRTIELPHPVVNVQLLDRVPDEAYRSVA